MLSGSKNDLQSAAGDSLVIFDAHTHIHFSAYNKDRDAVIKRAQLSGVKMITVGTNLETSIGAIAIAEKYPNDIWATAGCHPNDLKDFNIEKFKHLANKKKIVAIGECGLDYYRLGANRESRAAEQKKVFLEQIKLAEEFKKPLMVHCRPTKGTDDAYLDLIKVIADYESRISKIIHFFTGSLGVAKQLFDLGCLFTFGGAITFARDYDEVIKYLPLENILLETDAPYVAPAPYRGQRNEPAYVIEVAKKLAEIKNLSFEKAVDQTTKNVLTFC